MNNFIKPTSEFVLEPEYIQNLVNANLRKDLYDNEEICQVCHGTGMVIVNNPYGLSDDPDKKIGNLFPYKHQSISFCHHCYNGVVRRCKLCGKIMNRGFLKCCCEKQRKIDENNEKKKVAEKLNNAPIAPKEIEDSIDCFYSDSFSRNNGYFFSWDEFFEDWFENNDPDWEKPEYVWITEPVRMSIDAASIVESATEDLYEDACLDVTNVAMNKLQNYLDDWCKTCGVGITYDVSYKYKVRIPWENYNV